MAKIPCEIIRDLLPLYQDDICSESIMGESADAASVISDSIFIRISENSRHLEAFNHKWSAFMGEIWHNKADRR